MGRLVYAAESLLNYISSLGKLDACSTGLILGQSTQSKDYVVLLVRTPEQSDKEVDFSSASTATFQSVKEINESWIADHAKHVTKMLPGGMWVLGAFICSPSDLFSNNSSQSKAKSILNFLKKNLISEPLLYANSPSSEKLLLHFNITDNQYCCKSLDINNPNSTFQSVEWKFQNNYTKWCQVYCNFDPNQPSFGGNMSCPVKDQLKNALSEINKNLDKAMVILNQEVKNPTDTLESLIKIKNLKDSSKSSNELPSLKANIFLSYEKKPVNEKDIFIKDCDVELQLLGVLSSHVFLSQKSTIKEAVTAVKQDIMRSLATRFEMHWDSLVEEEYGSPEEKLSVHEPPRRISVVLPNSEIAFNDYLFPGEGASEVISSFKEMLDLNITESNLEKEIEMQGDSMEFYGKSSISLSTTSSDELMGSSVSKGFLLILLSVGIILIAVALALFIQRGNNFKEDK